MKFWIVTCTSIESGEKVTFTVATDDKAEKKKVKKDLAEVFPDYTKMSLKKTSPPDNWTLFEGKT